MLAGLELTTILSPLCNAGIAPVLIFLGLCFCEGRVDSLGRGLASLLSGCRRPVSLQPYAFWYFDTFLLVACTGRLTAVPKYLAFPDHLPKMGLLLSFDYCEILFLVCLRRGLCCLSSLCSYSWIPDPPASGLPAVPPNLPPLVSAERLYFCLLLSQHTGLLLTGDGCCGTCCIS